MESMPEMETNHIKTHHVGLSSGEEPRDFSSPRPPSFTLLFDVEHGTGSRGKKSTEGKQSGATAIDFLPHTGKQLNAQRLGC